MTSSSNELEEATNSMAVGPSHSNWKAKEDVLAKFREFDLNGDAMISTKELRDVLKSLAPHYWNDARLDQLFSTASKDNDDHISYKEFADDIFGKVCGMEKRVKVLRDQQLVRVDGLITEPMNLADFPEVAAFVEEGFLHCHNGMSFAAIVFREDRPAGFGPDSISRVFTFGNGGERPRAPNETYSDFTDDIGIRDYPDPKSCTIYAYDGDECVGHETVPNLFLPNETSTWLWTVSSAGVLKMYKNGTVVGTVQCSRPVAKKARKYLMIGGHNFYKDQFWRGAIREARIWNKEVSWEEAVATIFGNVGKQPSNMEDIPPTNSCGDPQPSNLENIITSTNSCGDTWRMPPVFHKTDHPGYPYRQDCNVSERTVKQYNGHFGFPVFGTRTIFSGTPFVWKLRVEKMRALWFGIVEAGTCDTFKGKIFQFGGRCCTKCLDGVNGRFLNDWRPPLDITLSLTWIDNSAMGKLEYTMEDSNGKRLCEVIGERMFSSSAGYCLTFASNRGGCEVSLT